MTGPPELPAGVGGTVETEPLRPQVVQRDPRALTLLEVNARFMPKVEYDRLVANMRRDGACTSAPLVWRDPTTGDEVVLSGNHRVQAAIDADLPVVTCLLLDQPLSPQRRVAIQLSHNAITGTDDPGLLAELYTSIGDVDLRAYCGLDDKTLDLLGVVQPEAFGEEPLAYATVALLFLPDEAERLAAVFEEATRTVDADELLAARYTEHRKFLAALDTVRDSYRVGSGRRRSRSGWCWTCSRRTWATTGPAGTTPTPAKRSCREPIACRSKRSSKRGPSRPTPRRSSPAPSTTRRPAAT
jgi:hypothetical protein